MPFSVDFSSALPHKDAGTLLAIFKAAVFWGIRETSRPLPKVYAYETQIDLRESIIDYITTNPGDILDSVLRPACRGNGCLDLPTEVKINVCNGDRPFQEETLIIHATGDYQANEADQFIDAIFGAARRAAQCEERTYTVTPVRSSYSVWRLYFEDTFFKKKVTLYKMSNFLGIYRHSAGGDENKHGGIEVTVEYEEVEGFSWCNLFDYASLIPKGDLFGMYQPSAI